MRRILMVLAVAALMVVTVALSGGPAFADHGSDIGRSYGQKEACGHQPSRKAIVCTDEFIPRPSEGHRPGTEGGGGEEEGSF